MPRKLEAQYILQRVGTSSSWFMLYFYLSFVCTISVSSRHELKGTLRVGKKINTQRFNNNRRRALLPVLNDKML